MQKVFQTLPEGYAACLTVDMQKNTKLVLLVNGLALLIGLVMAAAVLPFMSVEAFLNFLKPTSLLVYLVGMVLYMVLHEAVHGIAMKLCGTRKVKYGFTGLYAFAGSDDYYSKGAYIFIALAPVVLWGVVLAVLNVVVPVSWSLVVYMIQLVNISGAAGDYYVTVRFLGLPKDILVRDMGVAMTVFKKE